MGMERACSWPGLTPAAVVAVDEATYAKLSSAGRRKNLPDGRADRSSATRKDAGAEYQTRSKM
jgi:hypothetical protein